MEKTRRKLAREKAIVGLYQNLVIDSTLEDILNYFNEDEELGEDAITFSKWIVENTLKNKKSYQELISRFLKKGWTFERLGKMEQAILLVATCELLESNLPKTIVINEAINNAKKFCDEDSYKFINGVLGQII